MSLLRVHAIRFVGEGKIRCTRCGYMVVLPDDASAIVWDDGKRIKVLDPTTNLTIHNCDRPMKWWCDLCESEGSPVYTRVARKSKVDIQCKTCNLGSLKQVPVNHRR